MAAPALARWRIVGHSECGESHKRSDVPNQDSWGQEVASEGALPVVLALSDGHGSQRSPRSEIGSRLAVETAVETIQSFLQDRREVDLSTIKREAERHLPSSIVRNWKTRVDALVSENPLPEEHASKPYLAYGATLLVVAIGDGFVFYLQLGDGDILAVSDSGEVEHPLPPDARLIANETTSLCSDSPERLFRFRFQVMQNRPPALILASTDGYSNSFDSPDGFDKVGTDILGILRQQGLEFVQRELPGWLSQASREGSGDDVTVGLIWREADAKPGDDRDPTPSAIPESTDSDRPGAAPAVDPGQEELS